MRDALGPEVAVVDYLRPGFELSCRVAELSDARAVVLIHHGLVTWGETREESYRLTLELVRLAERFLGTVAGGEEAGSEPDRATVESFLVRLRGRLSRERRQLLAVDRSQRALAERDDVDRLARLRSTPDHMLRIGVETCVIALDDEIAAKVEQFELERAAAFARHSRGEPELSGLPKVVLVPGLGCVAAGPDRRAAAIRAEIAEPLARGRSPPPSTASEARAGSARPRCSGSSTGRSSSTS